ncbi:hypothetical protein GJAV_G00196010 [Gymnothorax javanicus]|nr:hypothetical protein GJAV_G00196010 [Gymnothorax javanicus]
MGRTKDLSDFDKGQIVIARRLGRSLTATASLVGCSRSAVVNTFRQWTQEGQITNRRQGVGRRRLIDAEGQQMLSHLVQTDRKATVAQVAESFKDGHGKNVSQHTVHRALLRMGLRRRRSVSVRMLTPDHHQQRLQWAQEHQDWTLEQWKKVVWSDESQFVLHHVDGRVRVRRLPGTEVPAGGAVGKIPAGGEKVTLWAMFCWESLGPIVHLEASLTPDAYLNIVADQVHPFMATVFPDGDGFFQQDGGPCCTAQSVQEWFEEHDAEFKLLPWPPNSPDLNPLVNLWGLLEQQVRSAATPPGSLEDLKELLLASWDQIPQDTFRGLIESLALRVKAVLAAQGGPTAY